MGRMGFTNWPCDFFCPNPGPFENRQGNPLADANRAGLCRVSVGFLVWQYIEVLLNAEGVPLELLQ
jgi:hypothetical protein